MSAWQLVLALAVATVAGIFLAFWLDEKKRATVIENDIKKRNKADRKALAEADKVLQKNAANQIKSAEERYKNAVDPSRDITKPGG